MNPPRPRPNPAVAIALLVLASVASASCSASVEGADGGQQASTEVPATIPSHPDQPPTSNPSTGPTTAAPDPTAPDPTAPDASSAAVAAESAAPVPLLLGTFDTDGASEVSGIAMSGRDPDRLWLLDDGPGTTAVIAVGLDGRALGRVEMTGVSGRDTEALAVAPCGPADSSPCLYVGDIGDNTASRERIQVHRFPEPIALDGAPVTPQTISLTHPTGPVDAEGMVVGADGVPLLLTKEEGATRLLAAPAFADGELVEVATLPLPQPAQPLRTLFVGLTVTDAALHPTGDRLLLRTYDSVLLLTPPAAGQSLVTLADWSITEVAAAQEPQGEAVTWATPPGRDQGYITASEDIGDLWYVPLTAPD